MRTLLFVVGLLALGTGFAGLSMFSPSQPEECHDRFFALGHDYVESLVSLSQQTGIPVRDWAARKNFLVYMVSPRDLIGQELGRRTNAKVEEGFFQVAQAAFWGDAVTRGDLTSAFLIESCPAGLLVAPNGDIVGVPAFAAVEKTVIEQRNLLLCEFCPQPAGSDGHTTLRLVANSGTRGDPVRNWAEDPQSSGSDLLDRSVVYDSCLSTHDDRWTDDNPFEARLRSASEMIVSAGFCAIGLVVVSSGWFWMGLLAFVTLGAIKGR